MSWDHVNYTLQRLDALTHRVRINEMQMADTNRRLTIIESWKVSLQTKIRLWPYIVAVVIMVSLNVAPAATVKIILETIQAVT